MKTISAVEARQQLGSLLNLVSLTHETVVIQRAGKNIAILSEYQPQRPGLEPSAGKTDIRALEGLGADVWQGMDVGDYLRKEREQWT